MQETLRQAIRGISNMAEYNEAIELMHSVRDNFRVASTLSFFKGDRVKFTRRTSGETFYGVVTKVNSVTITVDCGVKGNWKVSSTTLEHDRSQPVTSEAKS
jgi:hypothetical protein